MSGTGSRRARGVDVVVPVFNARAHVEPCLASVLRHGRGDFRLVIVDDASDEPGLAEALAALAASDLRVVLLRQEVNQGFVRTANRGMRHAAGRDVLLLNSDTLVPADFLDRLRACAQASQPPAIVTPLTNNGTICSVPQFMRENPVPPDLGVDGMNALVSRVSLRRRPSLVTAVGFCMWIPAEVLTQVGLFDEEHFGRGYGEENDLCERAKAAGFPIRLCDDLYVAHVGRASFGALGAATEIDHNDVIGRLHPTYHDDVQRFLRENPLRPIQDEIVGELARVAALGGPARAGLGAGLGPMRLDGRAPRILQVTNGFPQRAFGGVELHTFQLVKALRRQGFEVAVFTRHSDLAPDGTTVEEAVEGIPVWSVVNDFKGGTFRERWDQPPVRERFAEVLHRFAPDLVHIQHLIGLSADLPLVARDAGIPVVATVHEYWWVCERVMFQKRDGSACRGPAHESCLACVGGAEATDDALVAADAGMQTGASARTGSAGMIGRVLARIPGWNALTRRSQRDDRDRPVPPDESPVRGPEPNRERWRAMRAALDACEHSVTPSRFVLDELARHGMPLAGGRSGALALGLEFAGWPLAAPLTDTAIGPHRPLRLGFVGQHLPHKAPHVLLEAMLRLPDLPLTAVLHGRRWPGHPYEDDIAALLAREPRARWGGRFADGALPAILAGVDLLVVPSTCLEGFGIATREAFLAGRPVLSTTRGALPESVRDGIDGLLVPGDDPAALAAAIARVATEPGLLARLAAGALESRARVKSMDDYAAEIQRILYAPTLGAHAKHSAS